MKTTTKKLNYFPSLKSITTGEVKPITDLFCMNLQLFSACHDIDQWPSPVPGETLNLPIMGRVVQVSIDEYEYT